MYQKGFLEKNWVFALGWLVFIFTSLALQAHFGKDQLHLLLTAKHNPLSDLFFKYYTDWATTGFTIAVLVYIIVKQNRRNLLAFVTAFIVLTLISSFVKEWFFEFVHRPTYYFQLKNIYLRDIEGVRRQIPFTFPSGHTMNAFLSFGFAAHLSKNKLLQLLFLIGAVLVAYSRVYLSKHFALDTVGGATLGYIGMALVAQAFFQCNAAWLDKKMLKNG